MKKVIGINFSKYIIITRIEIVIKIRESNFIKKKKNTDSMENVKLYYLDLIISDQTDYRVKDKLLNFKIKKTKSLYLTPISHQHVACTVYIIITLI